MRFQPLLFLQDPSPGRAGRWALFALLADPQRWRSELVMHCIDDYLAGERFPLSLIRQPS